MTAVGSSASAQTEPFDLLPEPRRRHPLPRAGSRSCPSDSARRSQPSSASSSGIPKARSSGHSSTTLLGNDLCAEGFAFTDFWPTRDDNGNDLPDGVYTIEISGRTEAGETDAEVIQLGVISDVVVGEFLPPDIVNGPFELQMYLNPDFTAIATVTEIRLLWATRGRWRHHHDRKCPVPGLRPRGSAR